MLQTYRGAAGDLMQHQVGYLERTKFVTAANACDARRYRIQKPADVVDLWVREYFGVDDHDAFPKLEAAMAELTPARPASSAHVDEGRLRDASTSLLFELMKLLVDPDGPTSLAVAEVLARPLPSVDPQASPMPTPCGFLDLNPTPRPDQTPIPCAGGAR